MSYGNAFIFFTVLLLVSFLIQPIAKKIFLPFSLLLIILGFIASEVTTTHLNLDTGIRWDNFKTIIFYGFLPILIFQSAMEINIKALLKNSVLIFIMVVPLMLLSTLVTAIGLYKGINHADGFPWIAAFIAGALMSATDPASILSTLKKYNVSERLKLLLQGESLFNDATAIVLFSILISLATNQQETTGLGMMLIRFSEVCIGGAVLGAAIGFIAYLIVKLIKNKYFFVLISIVSAYATFILSEYYLGFSGVISVLTCGISLQYLSDNNGINKSSEQIWKSIVWISESMIYLLAGVSLTLSLFIDQWLAIVIGIVAVLLSRIVIIFGTFPFISHLPGIESVSLKEQSILVWCGIRGTVTLALALSLPLTLTYWYTIQSIAFGVVIFTLFVQTISLPVLIKNKS